MNGVISAERRDVLSRCQLFAGLSEASLENLAVNGQFVTLGPEEEIVSHRDLTDHVFVLLSGVARVTIYSPGGQSVSFGRIHPGSLFGEFSAIDGRPRSASVEVVSAVRVLRLTSELFWGLLHDEPQFTRRVVMHLAATARALTERVYEFSTLAVNNRIHAELLRLASGSRLSVGEAVISPIPTHAEIAERISTHREAVARELSKLAELGIVARRGQVLVVKDLRRLEKMVQDATGV